MLVFSWGDLNPYTNIHSGWVLLYWISSSLSPGSRASPFGTIIMSLLVVLQCEWLNAHGCIIYPQEASVSSRGCEFRLERRKLRGSEFLGISCQRLCLSQVFTTHTPTPNCSLRMNQERENQLDDGELGASPVVQWLRLCFYCRGWDTQVRSLVGELRSHMLSGVANKERKYAFC